MLLQDSLQTLNIDVRERGSLQMSVLWSSVAPSLLKTLSVFPSTSDDAGTGMFCNCGVWARKNTVGVELILNTHRNSYGKVLLCTALVWSVYQFSLERRNILELTSLPWICQDWEDKADTRKACVTMAWATPVYLPSYQGQERQRFPALWTSGAAGTSRIMEWETNI